MLPNKAAISSGVRLRFVLFKSTTGGLASSLARVSAGSVTAFSAGSDFDSPTPSFAPAKSAAISSALS